jgi:hypothetical protein
VLPYTPTASRRSRLHCNNDWYKNHGCPVVDVIGLTIFFGLGLFLLKELYKSCEEMVLLGDSTAKGHGEGGQLRRMQVYILVEKTRKRHT